MAWTRSLIACCCSSRTFGSARCWRRSKTWGGQQLNSQSYLVWAYIVVFGRERRGHCCECNGGLGVRRQPESANRRKRRARDPRAEKLRSAAFLPDLDCSSSLLLCSSFRSLSSSLSSPSVCLQRTFECCVCSPSARLRPARTTAKWPPRLPSSA